MPLRSLRSKIGSLKSDGAEQRRLLRAVLLVVSIPVIAHFGLFFQQPVLSVLEWLSHSWSKPISSFEAIQALWIAAVGIHAAVGAVAPILGYTLFATNITAASRIAPAGAVVATEIGWSRYLRDSLLLLVASLVGLLTAPSILGLIAAFGATGYVVLRTFLVFKQGFALFERPEKFDLTARKYLVGAIANIDLAPPQVLKTVEFAEFNASFMELPQLDRWERIERTYLHIGNKYRTTQVLNVERRGIQRLRSESEKNGYTLSRFGESVPTYLDRGEHAFLALTKVQHEVTATNEPVKFDQSEHRIDTSEVMGLQQLLNQSIVFGAGPWTDDITRLPMLAQRHIATVLYKAIPGEQPHDLEYGLDVLAEIIDEIDRKHPDALPYRLDAFGWIHEIPALLVEQACAAPHSRMLYARHIADFMRGRLAKWLPDRLRDSSSRNYLHQVTKLLRCFLKRDIKEAEYIALLIREIPSLARLTDLSALILVQRSLLLVFIDDQFSNARFKPQRKLLIRTLKDTVRYGPGSTSDAYARAETLISALGLALYKADTQSKFKEHVAEVIEELIHDNYGELPFFELLDSLKIINELNESWKWSWWEMDQKESGKAHWMSMDIWLTRAAMVAISTESWRLSYLEGESVPNMQVISAMQRNIDDSEEGWTRLLPANLQQQVNGLRTALASLELRRKKIVDARVSVAGIDSRLVEKYIREVMDEVRASFGAHNAWLSNAGALAIDESASESNQAGISRLAPREWFVNTEALDIPVHVLPPRLSSALIEFEYRQVVRELSEIENRTTEVAGFEDQRIWEKVDELLGRNASHILIVGVGVSEYDVWSDLESRRNSASSSFVSLSYHTLRDEELGRLIAVVDASKAFKITRRPPILEGVSIYEERLALDEGGIVSGIVEIGPDLQERWLRTTDEEKRGELESLYSESLLDRTVWSFDVSICDASAFEIFRINNGKRQGKPRKPRKRTA